MRLGIMCSGNGTNFENILRTCTQDEVVLMITNKKKCGAIKRANKFGVPYCHVNYKDEDKMISMFKAWHVDLIILAGYMRVLEKPSQFQTLSSISGLVFYQVQQVTHNFLSTDRYILYRL